MDIKVIRKNKVYDKRCLKFYCDNKLINISRPFGGWFSWDHKFDCEALYKICKYEVLKNLWWLIGRDCDNFTWAMQVDKWDRGTGVDGKITKNSQFFSIDEKLAALESFIKK